MIQICPKDQKNAFMLYSDTIREEVRAELIAASPTARFVSLMSPKYAENDENIGRRQATFHRRAQDCNCRLQGSAREILHGKSREEGGENYNQEDWEKKEKKKALSQLKGLPSTPEGWSGAFRIRSWFSQRPRDWQEHPEKVC